MVVKVKKVSKGKAKLEKMEVVAKPKGKAKAKKVKK